MTEPQDAVKALVNARNLGDPMKLLAGVDKFDCSQLTAALAERRRDHDLFTSQIRVVDERHSALLVEIATTEAIRTRRITEFDAATFRANIDDKALHECYVHGIGMVHGECTVQENFQDQSHAALLAARAALSAVNASLNALQVQEASINGELLSLKADLVALGDEINQILLLMGQKGCPIPPP